MAVKSIRGTVRDPKVIDTLRGILEQKVLCSMSTVSATGSAHVSTAYFAFSSTLEIYFFSYPDSEHARTLDGNPSMAIAIFDSPQVWGKPDLGLQMFGRCRRVAGKSAVLAARWYGQRFPGFRPATPRAEPDFDLSGLRAYRFVPRSLKLFDERSFGGGIFVAVPTRAVRLVKVRAAPRREAGVPRPSVEPFLELPDLPFRNIPDACDPACA